METKNPRGFQMLSSESSGDVMVETDSFLKQSMIYCNVNFLLDHCRNYSLWWGSILLLFPDTAAQSLFFVNTLHIFFNRWAEKKICILCLLSTLFKDQEEDNRKWSFRKMPNITVKQIRWLLRNKCKPCLLFWRLVHTQQLRPTAGTQQWFQSQWQKMCAWNHGRCKHLRMPDTPEHTHTVIQSL